MSETHEREERLFNEALVLPVAERPIFLRAACCGDETLCARVTALLREHEGREADFLASPNEEAARLARPQVPMLETPGLQIGRYILVEKLGEGGCGVVWLARQVEPVRRDVALKIIKLGMDTCEVIARFEAERQALALMDHPNIARVLDAGATEAGRPFFVMELVRGVRITEWCDERSLRPRERLELFIAVCAAVQHAHQKGIIHRDLKPANILVTDGDGGPVPKVIDFGIAKATQGRLTDRTLFTAFDQLLGTPAYMSPEQAERAGSDIDTRTDIYSLGVLLYELLTGVTPLDGAELRRAATEEIRRRIRETEPVRPSVRLRNLDAAAAAVSAKRRRMDLPRLAQFVRGDLDWIALRCLEKDRQRRYETVNGLARDLERFLRSEPVSAGPPGGAYVLGKFVRRHRFAFAAGGAILLTVLAGGVVATTLYLREKDARKRAVAAEQVQEKLRTGAEAEQRRAMAEERRAQAEAARSAQVSRFLRDLLAGINPVIAQGRDTTLLREIVDATAARVEPGLSGQPEVEADIRETLGSVYLPLGEPTRAEAMFKASLKLRRGIFGDEDLRVADTLAHIGDARLAGGFDAEDYFRQALALRRKFLGPADLRVAESLTKLGQSLTPSKLEEAKSVLREALAIERAAPKSPEEQIVATQLALGMALRRNREPTESEAVFREVLERIARMPDATEMQLARDSAYFGLGHALEAEDRLAESEACFRAALAIERKILDPGHPRIGQTLNMLGNQVLYQGRLAEAEEIQREQVTIARALYAREPNNHKFETDLSQAIDHLGDIISRAGRNAEAEPLLREAVAMRHTRTSLKGRGECALSLANLGRCLAGQGKLAEAEAAYREAFGLTVSVTEWREHLFVRGVAQVLQRQGKKQELEDFWNEATTISRQVPVDAKRYESGALTAGVLTVLIESKEFARAEEHARENLARWEQGFPDDWRTFMSRALLARSLAGQKKFGEAEPLLLSAYEGLQARRAKISDGGHYYVLSPEAVEKFLVDSGQPERAEKCGRNIRKQSPRGDGRLGS